LIHLAVFFLQAVLTLLAGRAALRFLGGLAPEPADDLHTGPVLRWAMSLAFPFTFGCAVVSLVFAVGGHLRLDGPTLTVLAALLAAPAVPESLRALRAGHWKFPAKSLLALNALERVVAAGMVVMGALAIGGALTPEVRHDPLFYHLQVPRLWLNFGRMVEVPENGHSYFPYGFEMLFAWSLSLGSDSAAKLMHFCAGLAGAVWCARLASLLRVNATSAAGLYSFLPTMCYLSTTTYIDLATAMYGLAGVAILAERVGRKWDAGRALALGLMAGSAMATKYTAWPLLGFPLGLAAAWSMRRQIPLLALCGVASLSALAPWVARNLLYVGNPVAPLMISVFGPESARSTGLAGGFDAFAGGGRSGLLLAPLRYAEHLLMQKYVLSLLGMIAGLAALAMRGAPWSGPARGRAALLTALCIGLYLAEAFFTRGHPDGRYGYTSMGVGGVLVALLCGRLAAASGSARACVMAPVLAIAMLAAAGSDWFKHQGNLNERWVPLLAKETRRQYLRDRGTIGPEFAAVEELLLAGPAGRVIGHGYPSRALYWSAILPMRNDLVEAAGSIKAEPDAIARALRDCGFTHVVGRESFTGFHPEAWIRYLDSKAPDLTVEGVEIRLVGPP